ncbi:MAG: hypothetical protein ACFE0Q_00760 [Anaerolineae bacterium]
MPRRWIIITCLLLFAVPIIPAQARDVLAQDVCIVEADQVVDGSLFAFCEELYIEGTVNGDVYGASIYTVITGTVNGSLYMVGGQMDVYGDIQADLHYAGAVLRLNPLPVLDSSLRGLRDGVEVEAITRTVRSIKAFTLSTFIYPDTVVEAGIVDAGYQLVIEGDVNAEVSFWGSTFILNGRIDGNTYALVGDPNSDSSQIETLLLPSRLDVQLFNPGLTVGEDGEITGLLSYQGPVAGLINGTISQTPNYVPPEPVVLTLDEPGFLTRYLEALGREFSTLLIIGVLVVFFASNFLQAPVSNLRSRPFASLGVGLLGFLLSFPIVLIILLLSLSLLGVLFILGFRGVVIAITLVLGLVNIGGISIFYFVAIFVTRALVGLAIGRLLLRVMMNRNDVDDHRWLQYLALAVGVFLIAVASSLPFIGILVNATALFLGLGSILIIVMAQIERFRQTAPAPAPDGYRPSPAVIRTHRISADTPHATTLTPTLTDPPASGLLAHEEGLAPPGTHNLPEGFDWQFFDD